MAEKPGYYAILPANVRYDTELSSTAKLLYAEITALSNTFGYCTAKNKYFAELYGIAPRSIQRTLEQLSEKGYIRVERDKTPRKIFISTVTKMSRQGDKNVIVMGDKNVTHNNTSINNIFNTVCSEQASEPPVITLTLNDNTEYPITQKTFDELQGLYPNADVMQELRKMRGWCNANPTRRKTKKGIDRFINSWLSREQDKGRNIKPQPDEPITPRYECVNEEDYSDCIGYTVE